MGVWGGGGVRRGWGGVAVGVVWRGWGLRVVG